MISNNKAVKKIEDSLGLHTPRKVSTRRKHVMPRLTQEKLESLPTERLLMVLKSARMTVSSVGKSITCECCGTRYSEIYPEDDFHKKAEANHEDLWGYYQLVKNILSNREHISKGSFKR